MKTLKTALITLVAVLALTAAAEAVDLWTPPLFVETDSRVECKLTNVTSVSRTMQIRIYDEFGSFVTGTDPISVAPFSVLFSDSTAGGYFTCRFTVPSKAYVRAVATVFVSLPGESQRDQVAVPAQ